MFIGLRKKKRWPSTIRVIKVLSHNLLCLHSSIYLAKFLPTYTSDQPWILDEELMIRRTTARQMCSPFTQILSHHTKGICTELRASRQRSGGTTDIQQRHIKVSWKLCPLRKYWKVYMFLWQLLLMLYPVGQKYNSKHSCVCAGSFL